MYLPTIVALRAKLLSAYSRIVKTATDIFIGTYFSVEKRVFNFLFIFYSAYKDLFIIILNVI